MAINIDELEKTIQGIASAKPDEKFIYDMLLAYDLPKSSITRLKKGDYNLSKNKGEILWKKYLYFKSDFINDLHAVIDKATNESTIKGNKPRFMIVTDLKTLLAIDTRTSDTLDIPFKDLGKHYDFFLPWAGMEKSQLQAENPADIKAAEKMGRLYDLILEDNKIDDEEKKHALNVFLSRLLFCFFAEDTNIFDNGQFTNSLASHTAEDGSDLHKYLHKLFQVLNVESRKGLPQYLEEFPYVNGGLFQKNYPVPFFSAKSRKIIIECGSLNWAAINPDIFGSMIQAVVHASQRGNLGMHYTSVANIMKVIEPLFLNSLYAEFEKAGDSIKKLEQLLERLYRLRIFDPACGSGNFLIIAYKELCKLEIEVFKKLQKGQISFRFMENIKLSQFYGIEIDDFAHETAKLSLWLAEHQMNLEFEQVFTEVRPTLPLRDGGQIICANATRIDWASVCPKSGQQEIYILGNPPYLGSRYQETSHKDDIAIACRTLNKPKKLDYIMCWFLKAAHYIKSSEISFAFVSTNSICQGEQVELIWPFIFEMGLTIQFTHQSFKWTNNARGNAGVTCVIIGIRDSQHTISPRLIFKDNVSIPVPNINAYLSTGSSVVVKKRSNALSKFPKMESGNKATDGGYLILKAEERKELVSKYSNAEKLIKRIYGAHEFLNGAQRWCLWINDSDLEEASKIPEILTRIEKVRDVRLSSKDEGAHKIAERPHQFREMKQSKSISLIFPTVSSERRKYIPIGYLGAEDVIIAPNQAIYDPPPHLFAIISSRIHMAWVRTVAGRLESRIRYSSALCYNTFPFPDISDSQKEVLEECVFKILDEREAHSEKTLAELYDPDKMPRGLRQVHSEMDLAVEKCYRKKLFTSDEERLEYLFKLYEQMIEAEKKKET